MYRVFCLFFLAILTALSAYSAPKPVVHLTFDEGEGVIAKDLSGNNHHAKLINPAWEEFGLRGRALRLNGKNAYVSIPYSKNLDLPYDFTYSIWVKRDKRGYGQSLFNRGNYNLGFQSYIFDSFIGFTSLKQKGPSICYTRTTYGTKALNPYYHIVITGEKRKDGVDGNIIRFYVNGKLIRNDRRFGGQTDFIKEGPVPMREGLAITIGNFGSNEGQWLDGLIDEVKIYNQPLTAKDIEEEYKELSKPDTSRLNSAAVKLERINLPPLKKNKAGIYIPPQGVTATVAPVKSVEWFEKNLAAAGVKTSKIMDADIKNLNSSDLDMIILPYSAISLECEDALVRFLAEGKTVLAPTCMPSVCNPDENGNLKKLLDGSTYMYHSRGWFAPFLIRYLDPSWSWVRRASVAPLGVNAEAGKIVGDLLPAAVGPWKNHSYVPMDRWNVIPNGDGGYGNGLNEALVGDVTLELYKEANGIPADFFLHRYFNNKFFNATFISLGSIGKKLLNSEKGSDILKALLHLAENRFPGEQPLSYYKGLINLSKSWADFSYKYMEVVALLRDAALYNSNGGKNGKYARLLKNVQKRFAELSSLRKEVIQLQANNSSAANIARTADKLAQAVNKTSKSFANYKTEAEKILSGAKTPRKPAVKSQFKQLQLIASLALPISFSRFRGDLFPEMKRLGVTVYSGQFPEWFATDKKVQEKFSGIAIDHKFVYPATVSYAVKMGRYNPASGTVVETPTTPYPYDFIRNYVAGKIKIFADAGIEQFRIGTGDETGLGFNFFGSAAEKEFQTALSKDYHQDINALNRDCGTAYKSFSEIKIPLRQPVTAQEHGVWELFRRCREKKLEWYYETFYKEIKKIRPELNVFHLPSTGSLGSALYGINFYNSSKHEDINGLDGTTLNLPKEWVVYDLTRTPLLTGEWGGVYQDRAIENMYGQMWKELSGGTLGYELHTYTWGSDSISFVDHTDLKNIRGALIRQAMLDSRKIEHVILDGKRAQPEIGILFSQTSRVHDQGWGLNGGSTTSTHIETTSNYYELFLKWQRSARVIPEEKVLEEGVGDVKIVILPQTIYLSEAVQKKLLEYVANGGIILAEGRAGRFDEFGKNSDYLFRKANIIPSFAGEKKFCWGKSVLDIAGNDQIFSPSGNGTVLAKFTKTPAITSVRYGKGHIVISGIGLGAQKYGYFPALVERILKHFQITPRFILSDDAVICREWVHNNDTYLILVKEQNNWDISDVQLKIRGKVAVEDYLFGKNVKSEYLNGYTVFSPLLTVGGRIFRIKNGTPAKLPFAPAEVEENKFKLASGGGLSDNAKSIAMPYNGRLYDEQPLKWNNFFFSLTTLASGDVGDKGETYLTISCQNEENKKLIEVGKDHYFRIKNRIFKIRSSKNFCKYPFHCELIIEVVKSVPPPKPAQIQHSGQSTTLANDFVACTFDRNNGAALTSMVLQDRRTSQLGGSGAKSGFIVSGAQPGPFRKAGFSVGKRLNTAGDMTGIEFISPVTGGLQLTQKAFIPHDKAGFKLLFECVNKNIQSKEFEIHYHPELTVGGSAESSDIFFIPQKGNTQAMVFRGLNAGKKHQFDGSWSAIVDSDEKLVYINTFKKNQIDMPYIWEASDFYTLEIGTPRKFYNSGEKAVLDLGFYFLRGLSGIDAWNMPFALNIPLNGNIDQKRPVNLQVEVGTPCALPQKISVKCELMREGKKLLDIGSANGECSYEQPFIATFLPDTANLADGKVQAVITITGSDKKSFKTTKEFQFSGNGVAKRMEKYNSYMKQLSESSSENNPEYFSLRILLEELRQDIQACDLEAADRKIEKIGKL